MRVLVVNAGSSSLKLSLLDAADAVIAAVELDAPRARADADELREALRPPLAQADAVGHRIVHGGERFRAAVRIDEQVRAALGALVELAPLHQPKSLAALDAVSAALPELPAVACFDTAFHATLAPAAATYALPAQWRERFGLRRFGFHGLSHAWVARRAPQLLDAAERDSGGGRGRHPAELRIVSCHLGAGASLCAVAGGRSLDTTMGFTPLEGLVMATRSGSVDPGMLLWLAADGRVDIAELADALEHRSGLLGLAGSADMREIVERAAQGDEHAQLGLDVYVHRLRGAIAAMSAALGGLDVLVFTGGVGERAPAVRARAAAGLGFLGVGLDAARNRGASADVDVSAAGARVRTLVIGAREDAEIARQTRALLGG
ncbi:MAG TPA: acetate/propionate family kinase [Solirubrobacteraceae bacterium]|nr:acetate/propionate family kinase [Solirubrobacteraceae bacterium]